MNIQKVKTEILKIASYNPRKDLKEKDPEYQKIKNSIQEFGYISPIIINNDMTVISGHQRLKVLKDMGITEIECIIVSLSKDKEKLLSIALNKISGEWDYQKLEILLNELSKNEIDLSITGFDEKEIKERFKDNIIDFVYKPFSYEAIRNTFLALEIDKHIVEFSMFGDFNCLVDGQAITFLSKKSEELLALIMVLKGKKLTMEKAISIL